MYMYIHCHLTYQAARQCAFQLLFNHKIYPLSGYPTPRKAPQRTPNIYMASAAHLTSRSARYLNIDVWSCAAQSHTHEVD